MRWRIYCRNSSIPRWGNTPSARKISPKKLSEQKSIQVKIASRKQEIQQLRTYQRGLYEGLIQNHLSQDEYFALKDKYEAKIEAVSKEIEQLKAGLAIIARQLEQYKMLSRMHSISRKIAI